jgi:hypothetical protein
MNVDTTGDLNNWRHFLKIIGPWLLGMLHGFFHSDKVKHRLSKRQSIFILPHILFEQFVWKFCIINDYTSSYYLSRKHRIYDFLCDNCSIIIGWYEFEFSLFI